MPEPFRPYEHLVKIKVLGKTVEVPERNSVLRCFQFLSPGNHSVRAFLLESGLPVLPHPRQAAR